VKCDGDLGVEAGELRRRGFEAVAPRVGSVVIGCVDAAPGEHVRAAHERGVLVPAHHEHLWTRTAVAQDDDGGGGTGIGDERVGHDPTMIRPLG
jgi:hypothetical protein